MNKLRVLIVLMLCFSCLAQTIIAYRYKKMWEELYRADKVLLDTNARLITTLENCHARQ